MCVFNLCGVKLENAFKRRVDKQIQMHFELKKKNPHIFIYFILNFYSFFLIFKALCIFSNFQKKISEIFFILICFEK